MSAFSSRWNCPSCSHGSNDAVFSASKHLWNSSSTPSTSSLMISAGDGINWSPIAKSCNHYLFDIDNHDWTRRTTCKKLAVVWDGTQAQYCRADSVERSNNAQPYASKARAHSNTQWAAVYPFLSHSPQGIKPSSIRDHIFPWDTVVHNNGFALRDKLAHQIGMTCELTVYLRHEEARIQMLHCELAEAL